MEKNFKKKFDKLIRDKDENFAGWDFSYLSQSGRMQEEPLTWNYYNEIMDYCHNTDSLLDMGTGGGEFLSSLPFLPEDTRATEGYEPNIEIAKKELEPSGIKVVPVEDDDNLPIASERFEVIINRHESYSVSEVKRILKNGGYFITQQVGGSNNIGLNFVLGAEDFEYEDWNLNKARQQLLEFNLEIIKMKEDEVKTRFYDIGAVLYYLKAIPWQIEDFEVEKYYDQLFALHKFIEKQGYIDFVCHRFLIIAKKS